MNRVVTRGFGTGALAGTVPAVVTRGFAIGETQVGGYVLATVAVRPRVAVRASVTARVGATASVAPRARGAAHVGGG